MKKFKLQTTLSSQNYVLFDHTGKIKKYANEFEIIDDFYHLRLTLYERRKDYLLKKLLKEYEILYNKVLFILAVNEGRVKV